jgi:hypothetical protein
MARLKASWVSSREQCFRANPVTVWGIEVARAGGTARVTAFALRAHATYAPLTGRSVPTATEGQGRPRGSRVRCATNPSSSYGVASACCPAAVRLGLPRAPRLP